MKILLSLAFVAALPTSVFAQTPAEIAQFEREIDKGFKSVPVIISIINDDDDPSIDSTTTKNCRTEASTRRGLFTYDWKTAVEFPEFENYDPPFISAIGNGRIASLSLTPADSNQHRKNLEALALMLQMYWTVCASPEEKKRLQDWQEE